MQTNEVEKRHINCSLGIIEVTGIVTAASCIDAMCKSAFVEVYDIDRIGSGMITIIIEGDLASVQFALEVGSEVALKFGELVAVKAIPRPDQGLYPLISPQRKGEKS